MSSRSTSYLFLACLLLLFVMSGPVLATDPVPEPMKPERERPLTGDRRLPDELRDKEPPPEQEIETDGSLVASWEKVAFQSYRDNNWEIYTSNFNYDAQRWTWDASADIEPSLSRDCNSIVFSAYRDGQSEIYLLANGVYKRLTYDGASDNLASFSPDGSRIVFQSYRDGNWEIYTMNADGSNQTRLTYGDGYDGDADWSPDGSKIAYSSYRNGGYRIWVMDADGKNAHQISNQPYSEFPAWSPDGSKIAYDADGDGDSWFELWLVNANGTGQTRLASPDYHTDFLAGNWSPDGNYIGFTRLYWEQHGGQWYWGSMHPYKWSVQSQYSSSLNVQSSTYDGFPDWQVCDIFPPVSSVRPLPEFSKESVRVEWGGYDTGGSNIKNYDIQYRAGTTGDWVDWQMATTATYRDFEPQIGDTIYFRSRARDYAGLVEEWPVGTGDASVTFYSWMIEGNSYDNRGTPLAGVVISETAVVGEPASDFSGFYRALFASYDFQFEPSWSKENFLTLPETAFDRSFDGHLDVYMPPTDNIVNDWGFESGIFSPGGWGIGGDVEPSFTDSLRHTGETAAFLGASPVIGGPTQVVTGYSVTFARQAFHPVGGDFHLVWQSGDYQNEVLNHAVSGGDGQWSLDTQISGAPAQISWSRYEIGGDGRQHLLWEVYGSSKDTMYHAHLDPGGSWTAPEVVYSAGRIDVIALAAGDDGSLHVKWSLSGTGINGNYYSYFDPAGNWSSPVPVDSSWYNQQIMVVDEYGRPHIISNYYGTLYHTYQDAGGNWTGRIQIAQGYSYIELHALYDDQNLLHVFWNQDAGGQRVMHMMQLANGSWTSPQILSTGVGSERDAIYIAPLDGGDLVVLWEAGGDNNCARPFYALYEAGTGEWKGPFQIDVGESCTWYLNLQGDGDSAHYAATFQAPDTQRYCTGEIDMSGGDRAAQCIERSGSSNSGMVMVWDGADRFHLIWSESLGSGIYAINDAATSLASAAESSSVYQVLTIPAAETHPTLSLLYLQGGANGYPGQGLAVSLESELGAATLYSDTASTPGWAHGWFDVSPWAGETVTLTISSNQVAGAPLSWLALDEVTLGSTYPDPWLDVGGQSVVIPGESLQVTIEYGNQGHVSAGSVQISMTVPAVFTYTGSSLAPSASEPYLVWDLGDLPAESGPGSIVVSFTVASEVEGISSVNLETTLTSETGDLEMSNNYVIWRVSLLNYSYLPLIRR